MEFKAFGKIPRINRACTVTEKIDGTNGVIHIEPASEGNHQPLRLATVGTWSIYAGSRTRWIVPGNDNHGFAAWVHANALELIDLGPGTHYGEWWGYGIQRGYGLPKDDKRFSLFNTARWSDPAVRPVCCGVVPVLYEDQFRTYEIDAILNGLRHNGSQAVPGFMDPEGIVVYHHAANSLFKATIKGDEEGKHQEAHVKKDKPARVKGDPSKGGRRKEDLPFEGFEKRKLR